MPSENAKQIGATQGYGVSKKSEPSPGVFRRSGFPLMRLAFYIGVYLCIIFVSFGSEAWKEISAEPRRQYAAKTEAKKAFTVSHQKPGSVEPCNFPRPFAQRNGTAERGGSRTFRATLLV